MADDIDRTEERESFALEMAERSIRERVRLIPTGEPGDCDGCGETFSRVVYEPLALIPGRYCGRCRDLRGLG